MSQINLNDEQIEHLTKFALAIMEPFQEDWGDLDGFTTQALAVKLNILTPHTIYEPCDEHYCNCAEYYSAEEWQEGITCYRLADWLERAAQLLREPVGEQVPPSEKNTATDEN